jgi:hypothetical protein
MMSHAGRSHRKDRAFGLSALKTSLVVGTVSTVINHPDPGACRSLLACCYSACSITWSPFLVAGYSRYTLLRRASTRQLGL